MTSGSVSLISDTAAIIDADADGGLDISASELRVSATRFGTLANPIETDLALLAAEATSGGIYFSDAGSLTLGTVVSSVERVGGDSALTTIEDSALTGLVATGVADGTAVGTITVETVQSDTLIRLVSTGGRVLDGGDTTTDLVAPSVSLTAAEGLGSNGSGALDIDTDNLDAENTGDGSVYLSLLSETTVSGIAARGDGSASSCNKLPVPSI